MSMKQTASLRDAAGKEYVLWLLAFAVTAVLFLLTACFTVPSYMTNDDVFFLQAIARIPREGIAAVTNTLANSAQEYSESMSILLCMVIGQFYRIDPDGFWYLGYHICVLLASLTVIGRCILRKTTLRRWPVWTGCLIHALLCAGVFLYALAVISFTVTSAIAGCAALALILCRGDARTHRGRVLTDIGSGLLIALCFLQRKATGICLLCFWGLAVAYQLTKLFLRRREQGTKPLFSFAAASAAALAAVLCLAFIGGHISDPGYREAEHYRSLVLDDILDEMPYEDYASLGIPQELATLIHGWYFMDERVTTENFKALAEIYDQKQAASPSPSPLRYLTDLTVSLAEQIREDPQMSCRFWVAAALLIACAAVFVLEGKPYWPEFFAALCACGGGTLLLLMLVTSGRFLTRVFLVVALPAITISLLMALAVPEERRAPRNGARRAAGAVLILSAAACAALCAVGALRIPTLTENVGRDEVFAEQRAIEEQLAENSELFYITSIYGRILDPLVPVSAYADNVALWGACGDTYRTEGRLYADAFFRGDVRFLTDRIASTVMLLQYLTLEHGPVQASVSWQHPTGLMIFDIDPVTPGEGYTGWYEQNGMTYYFENGQAAAGTRVIDGVTYEFAPAGAASPMQVVADESGTRYTTNAYSLLTGEG